jgi:aminopeptidase N
MVIGSGEMAVAEHRPAVVGRDTIPITVWTYAEDSAFANDVPFARATEIVETMSRIVGPYPYTKLAHVESSTRYGGMENATAIFYAEDPYVKRSMKEGVVRHETAHQWFGDAVTPREWAHLWLSEGFASYFDLVIGAALSGDSVLVKGMKADKAEWLEANVSNRPIVDIFEKDPNKLLNANVYPKGAWVLHMLREQVGDSAFFRGVRAYYKAYRDSSVVSAQFQEKIEDASGQRLGWFFQQWLYQAGCPKIQVRWSADTAAHTLQVSVQQVQPQPWGRFRLPSLPLALVMPDGSTERRVITVNAQNETVVTLPWPGAAPTDLIVDPDGTLLVVSTVLR